MNSLYKQLTGTYQEVFLDTDQQDNEIDYVDAEASSGQADVDVGDGGNFAVGEDIIIYDGSDTFETATIESIDSNTLTLISNLTNTYPPGSRIGKYLGYLDTVNNKFTRLLAPDLGDGSDGDFVSSGDETWDSEKNFTSVTIQSGHTITINGNVDIKCQGTFEIESGGVVSAKGKGYGGGIGAQYVGFQGKSELGNGAALYTRNGSGGGGGYGSGSSSSRSSGAGGGYGDEGGVGTTKSSTPNYIPEGGTTKNDEALTNFTIEYLKGGGGGGGGSSRPAVEQGDGGAGGGIIRIHALNFICAGEVDCDGNDGDDGDNPSLSYYTAGGGGGAGGTIFIQVVQLATLGTGLVHANGGAGGNGYTSVGAVDNVGGHGGDGRVRIEAGKIIGTTDPTYATDYENDMGGFAKYGWYHTAEIKTLNEIVIANAYVKQEIVRTANIAGATSSGQADVEVDDASVFNAGDKVILYEDDKMEIVEIESIDGTTLTMTTDLVYDYTTSGDVFGIDVYPSVSIEPVGDDEYQQEMVLQSVANLGSDIWYLTWSKTVRVDNTPANGEAGVRLVGRVRLQGKENDTNDINVTEINWSFY